MCHQRDGNLCGGWLACHDRDHLLALRMSRDFDPDAVRFYSTTVPVFASGAEACAHGLRDIDRPGSDARKMISGLQRLKGEV